VTVFAGVPPPTRRGRWDEACGLRDPLESVAVRKAEETAALSDTPHRHRFMELLDAQYLEGDRNAQDGAAIAGMVRSWAAVVGRGTVAVPAGAGNLDGLGELAGHGAHSRARTRLRRIGRGAGRRLGRRPRPDASLDHLFVRDVVVSAIEGVPGVALLLYEELPYLWGRRADGEVRRVAATLGANPRPLVVPVDRVAKAARISVYRSQVPFLFHLRHPLDVPQGLPQVERYWLLTRDSDEVAAADGTG
jgi:hypothetical protein